MSKQYYMPGTELTPEQKESIEKFKTAQIEEQQKRFQENLEMSKAEREILIQKLLNTKIEAFEDRVVVYPDPPEVVTVGGLIIPAEVQDKQRPSTGTVLVVGPGKVTEQSVSNLLLFNILVALHAPGEMIDKCKQEIQSTLGPKIQPGDRIMFGRFAGTPFEDPDTGAEVLIMRPSDCFVKL